jgi:hypothetical protein
VSIENWCVHHASRGDCEVRPVLPATEGWGAHKFLYLVTQRRELLPHDQALEAIRAGRPRPRVLKVAVRRTFPEVDRLVTRWLERGSAA